jgi:hypothetical protein
VDIRDCFENGVWFYDFSWFTVVVLVVVWEFECFTVVDGNLIFSELIKEGFFEVTGGLSDKVSALPVLGVVGLGLIFAFKFSCVGFWAP